MSEILETVMLLCFGLSWPTTLVKSYRAKTAKSTSLPFLLMILLGYVAGIASKLISGRINYVLVFYVLNFIFVALNIVVYFKNKGLDKQAQGM